MTAFVPLIGLVLSLGVVPGPTFAQAESSHDARLGVYAVDTGSGRTVTYHADQRFAYASTLKTFAAAAVLDRTSEAGMSRVVHYTRDDLVDFSPVTSLHVDEGMTLTAIADAAITVSDNTAGNLLFRELGGPAGLERQLRATGDHITSVDRIEPDLNTAIPGDRRDTTTPRAFGRDLRAYALGWELCPGDRGELVALLRANTTGGNTIRAGVPAGWTVGDKTGTASYGSRNDIAVLWPPAGAPIVLTVFTTHDDPGAATDDALVAEATRIALARLH
ncbi:class A beta-lactamase [Actinoplanes sp. NPDC051343]|jgi:beta-lactamase class A|uniref:class A beta-lactamase n=1 Tax=Actinoplanes sp. NPDC051343 TaxID=3363906 RepID=UPI00378A3C02